MRTLTAMHSTAFARFLKEEERSDATVEKYLRDVKHFIAFIGSNQVNKQRILDYKTELIKAYAPSSANSMLAALNAFLRFCGWNELCVKQFRVQRQVYRSEEKELTQAEYRRLVETAASQKNDRLSLILQTICGTGIRVSELRYITVEAAKRGEVTVTCKGKNRRIFLVPKLQKKLLRYAKEQKIRCGSLFLTKNGTPISRHAVWRGMKALCQQAKVPSGKVFPHNLRHLFARAFYRVEKDLAKLADILGHASINTTRIYLVETGAEHRQKMELLRLIL